MQTCFHCKGPLRIQWIEHMHYWRGHHYLIKNVRAEVCEQCGEAFLSPTTLKEIDRLVVEDHPTAVQHVLTILKPSGRAATVLPDNCLFADQAGEVFQILTHDCDLHTVLRLPAERSRPTARG